MRATVEEINSVQRRIKLVIPTEAVNTAFQSAFGKIQRKANIQGFRPGKAPLSMVKRLYKDKVSYDVFDDLVKANLFTAIEEQGVQPISRPYLENDTLPTPDQDFEVSAIVDIMPQIQLGDAYKGLEAVKTVYEVTDTFVDDQLARLARRQGKVAPSQEGAVAEAGNLVAVEYTVTEAGQARSDLNAQRTAYLGEGTLPDEVEAQILGMKKGESKSFTVNFAQDHKDLGIAGRTLEFHLTLNEFSKIEVPTLDDDFAKDLDYTSMAHFREEMKQRIAKEAENNSKNELERKLFDSLVSKVSFEVPPTMVEQVIDSIIQEANISDAEKKQATANQELRKSLRAEARRRVQNTLILWEIAKKENLVVSDEEVKAHIQTVLDSQGAHDDEHVHGEDCDHDHDHDHHEHEHVHGEHCNHDHDHDHKVLTNSIDKTFQQVGPRVRENLLFQKAVQVVINAGQITTVASELK